MNLKYLFILFLIIGNIFNSVHADEAKCSSKFKGKEQIEKLLLCLENKLENSKETEKLLKDRLLKQRSDAEIEKKKLIDEINGPKKIKEYIQGGAYKTKTYWKIGEQVHQCLPELIEKSGMIIIGAKDSVHHKGKGTKSLAYGCSPSGHCNGLNESCETWYRNEGCYLDEKWYEWYMKKAKRHSLPTDDKLLCS